MGFESFRQERCREERFFQLVWLWLALLQLETEGLSAVRGKTPDGSTPKLVQFLVRYGLPAAEFEEHTDCLALSYSPILS